MLISLPFLWWACRVTGLVAYGALWFAMFFGVSVSAKGSGGWLHIASAAELHKQWAVVGLGAALVHALAAVLAPEGGIPAMAVLVPLVSPTMRGVITVGTIAMWGFGGLVVSSLTKASWRPEVWRALHALSFGAWVLAVAHTVLGGTDMAIWPVKAAVYATAAVLIGATAQRILVAMDNDGGAAKGGKALARAGGAGLPLGATAVASGPAGPQPVRVKPTA